MWLIPAYVTATVPTASEGLLLGKAGKGRGDNSLTVSAVMRLCGQGGMREPIMPQRSVCVVHGVRRACILDAQHDALSAHCAQLSARSLAQSGGAESCKAVCFEQGEAPQAVMPGCRAVEAPPPGRVLILCPPTRQPGTEHAVEWSVHVPVSCAALCCAVLWRPLKNVLCCGRRSRTPTLHTGRPCHVMGRPGRGAANTTPAVLAQRRLAGHSMPRRPTITHSPPSPLRPPPTKSRAPVPLPNRAQCTLLAPLPPAQQSDRQTDGMHTQTNGQRGAGRRPGTHHQSERRAAAPPGPHPGARQALALRKAEQATAAHAPADTWHPQKPRWDQ